MTNRKLVIFWAAFAIIMVALQVTAFSSRRNQTKGGEARFTVRIENISDMGGQTASNGTKWPFALSPGFWVVHESDFALFSPGKKAGSDGLEAQAEDGNPAMLIAGLMSHHASVTKRNLQHAGRRNRTGPDRTRRRIPVQLQCKAGL